MSDLSVIPTSSHPSLTRLTLVVPTFLFSHWGVVSYFSHPVEWSRYRGLQNSSSVDDRGSVCLCIVVPGRGNDFLGYNPFSSEICFHSIDILYSVSTGHRDGWTRRRTVAPLPWSIVTRKVYSSLDTGTLLRSLWSNRINCVTGKEVDGATLHTYVTRVTGYTSLERNWWILTWQEPF